ncbi:hypothetical protein D3C83_18360 [compost metagenome]
MPAIASSMKPRLVAACRMPKSMSAPYRRSFVISAPPASAPSIVAPTPSHLFAQPTSDRENSGPRSRKAVVRLPAKASPSL